MKTLRTIGTALLAAFAVLGCCLFTGCEKDSLETKGFVLYYTGMTDIGPSQSGTIARPTYKNGTPSDFAITKVNLDGESYDNENLFSIDPATGAISIQSSRETKTGLYSISVSCVVDGKTHGFADAVQVKFLQAVPAEITVNPASVDVKLADLNGFNENPELPTAQVETDGDHISITNYTILNVKFNGTVIEGKVDLFSISGTGEITINPSSAFRSGVYTLDLKLFTAVADAESTEGIFENAFTVNVTSEPLSLTYSPNPARMEEETEGKPLTKFTSAVPAYEGSRDEIVFSFEKIEPATDKIKIDSETGVISIDEGHGFKVGDSFVMDVRVVNKYSAEGVLFPEALTLNVIEFIAPIENFSYSTSEVIQQVRFSVKPAEGLVGDYVNFAFTEGISEEDAQNLSIDAETGEISAKKGHGLSLGEHKVGIRAFNDKNEQTAEFAFTVVPNPNFFTYFSYGNNLGLTEEQTRGASQFRVSSEAELAELALSVAGNDIPEGVPVKWEIVRRLNADGSKIDETTGQISLAGWKANNTGILVIRATAGEGDAAVSVTLPVCINYSSTITPTDGSKCTISYNPFVFRVNPRTGGRFTVPTFSNSVEATSIFMDYRRTFNWVNLNGVRSDGTEHESGRVDKADATGSTFLRNVWAKYIEYNSKANYASKHAVSYFENVADLSQALLYVDNTEGENKLSIVVNPNKFYDDGWADGLFHGQITCSTKSSNVGNGAQFFPVVIWFDKNYNE